MCHASYLQYWGFKEVQIRSLYYESDVWSKVLSCSQMPFLNWFSHSLILDKVKGKGDLILKTVFLRGESKHKWFPKSAMSHMWKSAFLSVFVSHARALLSANRWLVRPALLNSPLQNTFALVYDAIERGSRIPGMIAELNNNDKEWKIEQRKIRRNSHCIFPNYKADCTVGPFFNLICSRCEYHWSEMDESSQMHCIKNHRKLCCSAIRWFVWPTS